MCKPTLVLIDLQLDFFDMESVGSPKKAFCLPRVRELLEVARREGWGILHVVTNHKGDESFTPYFKERGFPRHAILGTPGVRLVEGLHQANEAIVAKSRFSAFYGTELADRIPASSTVVLAGVASDCCVLHTALDAASRNRVMVVPFQAVSATQRDLYVASLVMIEKSCGHVVDMDKSGATHGVPYASIKAEELRRITEDWFAAREQIVEAMRPQYREVIAQHGVKEAIRRLESSLAAVG